MRYALAAVILATLPSQAMAQSGPVHLPPPAGYSNPLYLSELLQSGFYHLSFVRALPYMRRAPNWVLNYAANGSGPVDELPTYKSSKSSQMYAIVPIARRSWHDQEDEATRPPRDRAFLVFAPEPDPLMWLYTVTDGYGEWFGTPPDDIRAEVERLYSKLERS